MKRIGLLYVKGSLPNLENFGNLPTDLIKSNGLLGGNPISEELDCLILPGGSLIESGDISNDFKKEIIKMAKDSKPVIGICAGFQLLSNNLDVGDGSRNDGLGLIDAYFEPLTLSEHLKAKVCPNSFLTKGINEDIKGYHTHSFGKITGDCKELIYSRSSEGLILSGACNDEGNVIGTMVHNILDENENIKQNLIDYIDVKDINEIYNANKKLKLESRKEIGIDSGIKVANNKIDFKKPKYLMITSTSATDKEGKSFATIGLAGALQKRGYKVGLLKVGPIVTDLIQGFYQTKGVMEDYTSINGGYGGWVTPAEAFEKTRDSNYDIVLIEGMGAMGNFQLMSVNCDFRIASENNIPILIVSSFENETGALYSVKSLNQAYKDLYGKKIDGVLFNKTDEKVEIEDIGNVFNLPEIEKVDKLKYDIYANRLLKVVEENIDVKKIIEMI